MRGLFLVGILCLAGCQNFRGPLAPRSPERVDDPHLTIFEQQRNGRNRLALPDESTSVGPMSGAAQPGMPANK